jgi:uncharacterized protein (TIGR03083 family)
MARPQDGHLWALAQAERAALAKDLAGLGAEHWRHDTLCGEWDVEQVVAHLTAAASLNQWQCLRSMLGARFRPDTTSGGWPSTAAAPPLRRLTGFAPSSPALPHPHGTPRPTSARSLCMPKTSASRWGLCGHRAATRLRPYLA